MKRIEKISVWSSLLAAVSMASNVTQARKADEAIQFEEVIVVATHRAENLQNIPVSITAFNGEQLENRQLDSLQDIARFTPGFTGSSFNNSSPVFAIRGANNTFSQAGASKPVGIFFDEVFLPRYSAADFDLFDLEQVSVLRGPQGTLFGRNVTGGVIQISTVKPSTQGGFAKVRLAGGNLDYGEVAFLGNLPLTDTAAGKISLSQKTREGYITDRFNGLDYNDIDTLSARGQFLWEPFEALEIIASADYMEDDNNSRGVSFVSSNDGTSFDGNDGDIRTAELNVPQRFKRDIQGSSLRVKYAFDAGTFSSITAYRDSEAEELYSLGSGAVALSSVGTQFIKAEFDAPKSFSQEFRFVSAGSEVFDYILGAFYYNEKTDRRVDDVLLGAGGNAVFFDRTYDVTADTESSAIYADATLHLGSVDISVGARYTDEEKAVVVDFLDNGNPENSFRTAPGNDFSETTTRIAVNWTLTEYVTVFASRTEGFTAGGFNTETNSVAAIERGFAPETLVAYELGAKTEWFDRRCLVNLTLFNQEFKNKQEGFFNVEESFFSIFNAAEATMEGVEIETRWLIGNAFTLNASYAYLDASYDDFIIPGGADYSGNQLQTAPENTYSLGLSYDYPVFDNGTRLLVDFDYTNQDDYFTSASNQVESLIESYSLVNASVGVADIDDKWKVSLWAKNLTDEEYVLVRGFASGGGIGEFFGPPRTYGISGTYTF